jgi:hypothetical protein
MIDMMYVPNQWYLSDSEVDHHGTPPPALGETTLSSVQLARPVSRKEMSRLRHSLENSFERFKARLTEVGTCRSTYAHGAS